MAQLGPVRETTEANGWCHFRAGGRIQRFDNDVTLGKFLGYR